IINNSNGTASSDGTAPANINLDRGFTDFTADYMAWVTWDVNQAGYKSYGYGITGFETDTTANTIFTAGTTIFSGRGLGQYSNGTGNITTYFDITANVDFGTRAVSLASTNTCISITDIGCTVVNNQRTDLNFKGELTYLANTNALELVADTSITTAGSDGDYDATNDSDGKTLTGTASAKFYGPATNEFGGTFSLQNTDSLAGYVGFFGGQIGYILTETTTTTVIADTIPAFNQHGLTGFNDTNRRNKADNALAVDNLVRITRNTADGTVTLDEISGAVAMVNFNADRDFVGSSYRLYFANEKYFTTSGGNGSGGVFASDSTSNGGAAGVTIDLLTISKQNSALAFDANYLALIRWDISHADYTSYGYGFAGFATAGTTPILSDTNITFGTASFTGYGRGIYSDASGDTAYRFVATANVDFSKREVALSSETCNASQTPSACSNANKRPAFDFTGTLSYVAGSNALTGTLTTKGTDADHATTDGTELSGTANAKFYGPSLEEFGGTFNLSNFSAGYTGFFVGERGWLVSVNEEIATQASFMDITDPDNPVTITTPTTFANYADGFEDEARFNNGTPLDTSDDVGETIALKALAVQATRDANGEIITANNYTGAVAQVTYDAAGHFTKVSVYFDDKRYTGEGTAGADFITNPSPSTSDGVILSSVTINKSGADHVFGFSPKYIARLLWLNGNNVSDIDALGITGFETDGNNIPDTPNATFRGQGAGTYSDNVSTISTSHYFSATAEVDFSEREVVLTTDNTCRADFDYINCSAISNRRPDLNLTGTLSYDDKTNNISGTVTTAGTDLDFDVDDNDGTTLSGKADARFYGPAAEELGGTFSLSNDSASYIGWFGTEK
ncbi:MAG: transferrin-binding protein-like solute binding protein, partial [Alphaproteobacteria bacterium]|nr:transferrin-binding protein-like solute binding protein [Alphaproteobacteria bacterium]